MLLKLIFLSREDFVIELTRYSISNENAQVNEILVFTCKIHFN